MIAAGSGTAAAAAGGAAAGGGGGGLPAVAVVGGVGAAGAAAAVVVATSAEEDTGPSSPTIGPCQSEMCDDKSPGVLIQTGAQQQDGGAGPFTYTFAGLTVSGSGYRYTHIVGLKPGDYEVSGQMTGQQLAVFAFGVAGCTCGPFRSSRCPTRSRPMVAAASRAVSHSTRRLAPRNRFGTAPRSTAVTALRPAPASTESAERTIIESWPSKPG